MQSAVVVLNTTCICLIILGIKQTTQQVANNVNWFSTFVDKPNIFSVCHSTELGLIRNVSTKSLKRASGFRAPGTTNSWICRSNSTICHSIYVRSWAKLLYFRNCCKCLLTALKASNIPRSVILLVCRFL